MTHSYYLDGYNLIFTRELDPDPLREAREALIDRLAPIEGPHLILVFDAARDPSPLTRTHKGHLEIVYTAPGQTADDYILTELQSWAKPRQTTVVSRDKRLLRHCRDLGAHTQTPKAFFSYIDKKTRPSALPPPDLAVDHYLKIFKKSGGEN
ncbi:MAG: NYN domain-containing protein [Parachlamydiales bacterium]